MIMLIYS